MSQVGELMDLCDRLEAQLATAQAERSRLLTALLNEALNETDQRLETVGE